ncbi:decaprenyl-phosphate phosphoribosyltransferase [Sideroxydans sp. CL21]|uniref:decaprenyl-phosphate phosphoribosyltransferase n=1 Tax=Sideroxydans sp. CL21 TaxID=2600596 RepID=UPI0024BD54CE|nr:decaprenyl-phosphate phosphoribosyltransferase [Sideroxydans sp. CL21]
MYALIKLMRPHQWVKNAFVFTGLLFSHSWHNVDTLKSALLAAAGFSLVASATYIINDYFDRERDAQHPLKKSRPLASGVVSVQLALSLAVCLGITGVVLSAAAGQYAAWFLLGYIVLTLSYTLRLKHVVILDVFVIAGGFMLRILAGTIGIGIPPSNWLLLCGFMLTLFLGFAKRRSELLVLEGGGKLHRKVLGDYNSALLDKMLGVTAACTMMSYGLYTVSADTYQIHHSNNLIYTLPLVSYGIFRYLYLLHQHRVGSDPAREMRGDAHLLVIVVLWMASVILLTA